MADNMQSIDLISDVLDRAIVFVTQAHRGAFRKGTEIPYILHPLETQTVATETTQTTEMGSGRRRCSR